MQLLRDGEELSARGKLSSVLHLASLPLRPLATALDNLTFSPFTNIHSTHYMPGTMLYIHALT